MRPTQRPAPHQAGQKEDTVTSTSPVFAPTVPVWERVKLRCAQLGIGPEDVAAQLGITYETLYRRVTQKVFRKDGLPIAPERPWHRDQLAAVLQMTTAELYGTGYAAGTQHEEARA